MDDVVVAVALAVPLRGWEVVEDCELVSLSTVAELEIFPCVEVDVTVVVDMTEVRVAVAVVVVVDKRRMVFLHLSFGTFARMQPQMQTPLHPVLGSTVQYMSTTSQLRAQYFLHFPSGFGLGQLGGEGCGEEVIVDGSRVVVK